MKRTIPMALYNAAADAVTLGVLLVIGAGAALWYWGAPRAER